MSESSGNVPRPRLFHDLQLALATLYSLPIPPGSPIIPPNDAHNYLMHMQSRNIRRRIQAIHQSHHDHQLASKNGNHKPVETHDNNNVEMGSSWLACLFLLVSAHTATEQLFCAQTLLHRLRRNRILEAIDWEVEHPQDYDEQQVLQVFRSIDVAQIVAHYKSIMRLVHPFVGAVLNSVPPSPNTSVDEERAKGELTLLTLASLLYLLLLHEPSLHDGRSWQMMPPIAATLGGAMATLALRLCCAEANTSPSSIVSTVTHALRIVWDTVTCGAQANHGDTRLCNQRAFTVALHASLRSIPEIVMGSMQSSGVRGRLSMDPKSLRAAMNDVRRTGISELWELLKQFEPCGSAELTEFLTLDTCAQWGVSLPLSNEICQLVYPLVNKYLCGLPDRSQRLALALEIAVFEGGSWTVEDVLAHSLGLSEQQTSQQLGKKKPSNKSKKRHNAKMEAFTTDTLLEEAQAEIFRRFEIACSVAALTWDKLLHASKLQLHEMESNPHTQVDGEGSIGCVIAASKACIPHIVRSRNSNGHALLVNMLEPLRLFCKSTNRSVRALAIEALYSIHKAVAKDCSIGVHDETLLLDLFNDCAMALAVACSYPTDYFDDLSAASDEELEIERNDVRDLWRALSLDFLSSSSTSPGISARILFRLVNACRDAVSSANANHVACPESAVHGFSALAKPLNQRIDLLGNIPSPWMTELTQVALETLLMICKNVLSAFDGPNPETVVLSLSRIANIALASLSPFLSGLCVSQFEMDGRPAFVDQILTDAVELAARSIERLPELAAQSMLGRHLYDIRGAMRGPGGEDHVGCLALMRLVNESEVLAQRFIRSAQETIPRLYDLHTRLKMTEVERGQGVWHGTGVTPKSRRILLSVLCRLDLLGAGGIASSSLSDLFQSTVDRIASLDNSLMDESMCYELCEAVHDLVSYPSSLIRTVFEAQSSSWGFQCVSCLRTVTQTCLKGYHSLLLDACPDATCEQWNRLRAAVFYLLTSTGAGDIPGEAARILRMLIEAECEAIVRQCEAGPHRQSNIFCDSVISEDRVPAGVFVRVFTEIFRSESASSTAKRINSAAKTLSGALEQPSIKSHQSFTQAIFTLSACKDIVLTSVLHTCQEPDANAFVDPRPTLLEAWLLTMIDMMQLDVSSDLADYVKFLLTDTLVSVISLLFYPSLRRPEDRTYDPGLSFDGPQSLAIMEFLAQCFQLPLALRILPDAGENVRCRLSLDYGVNASASDEIKGLSIVAASLFRAAQGGLPPWAVEAIPDVFSSFFQSLDRDIVVFGKVLRLAMDVRLHPDVAPGQFGGLQPGKLLSGRYFESLSDQAKDKFVQDAMVLAGKNDGASWRRLKVLIKAACGGKKKDSGFQLKPAFTKWDFERL